MLFNGEFVFKVGTLTIAVVHNNVEEWEVLMWDASKGAYSRVVKLAPVYGMRFLLAWKHSDCKVGV